MQLANARRNRRYHSLVVLYFVVIIIGFIILVLLYLGDGILRRLGLLTFLLHQLVWGEACVDLLTRGASRKKMARLCSAILVGQKVPPVSWPASSARRK